MTNITPTLQKRPHPTEKEVKDKHKREIQKSINCARPGVIISYDPGVTGVRGPTATVQIAQLQVTSIAPDGTQTLAQYPPIELVPVVFMRGGRYRITMPVAEGDECLLIFCDRQIDNWLEQGAGQPPTIGRVHDITDAIAIVGLDSNPNAPIAASTDAVQVISDDYTGPTGAGEIVSISPGNVLIAADTVQIHGRVKASVDCDGTGVVYTPGNTHTYTNTGSGSTSNPPGPL